MCTYVATYVRTCYCAHISSNFSGETTSWVSPHGFWAGTLDAEVRRRAGRGMSALTPTRLNSLTPASTATNGTNITRADFQRWAHEDRNHSTATTTREEREQRRKFRLEEKERWRKRGDGLRVQQKQQLVETATEVARSKELNAGIGQNLRTRNEDLKKMRGEQQKKWADHGYELTQTYTIKAAQNNMRSLKAQNAGIVNSMHAKRADHETIVEAQRQQAQEERRQRVEKIKSETTDAVTRAAKKAFVDERWDIADNQRCVLCSRSRAHPALAYLAPRALCVRLCAPPSCPFELPSQPPTPSLPFSYPRSSLTIGSARISQGEVGGLAQAA